MELNEIFYTTVYLAVLTVAFACITISVYHFSRFIRLINRDERRKHIGLIVVFVPRLQTEEMSSRLSRSSWFLLLGLAAVGGAIFLEQTYGKPAYMHQ